MTKISIITPAHIDNEEKQQWFKETQQSVINQSFTDWEMIIVDDFSPLEVKSYFDDNRIKITRTTENEGPSLCRNTGVSLANSDCILPLDADDLLENNNVLEQMYNEWIKNKSKIIYGDLQIYNRIGLSNEFQKGKTQNLPEYQFEYTLDLRGIMPVTAMHSKDCHVAAGGWKKELSAGLEDVEYWISAGKTGFCGKRIKQITLLYRKHKNSRSSKMRSNVNYALTEQSMKVKIKSIHNDVFEGRFPVGCCGGGRTYQPKRMKQQPSNVVVNIQSDVSKLPDDQKVKVTYTGNQQGTFQILGKATDIAYQIRGSGYTFVAHKDDAAILERYKNGEHFKVEKSTPLPQSEPQTIEYRPPKPEVIQIERMPKSNYQVEVQPPEPQSNDKNFLIFDLSVLDLNDTIKEQLEGDVWTVQSLANANKTDLQGYKGIGERTEQAIIDKAKEYLKNG